MLYHNFKVSIRNIKRNGLFHGINVLGLGLSISFILLIYLYVSEEFAFDRFYENSRKIFMIENTIPVGPSKGMKSALLPNALSPGLEADLPISVTRYKPVKVIFILNGEKQRENVSYVDKSFLSIFNQQFVSGDSETALSDRKGIIISESIAIKYFGRTDAVGQVMMRREEPFVVTGVIKDRRNRSSIETEILIDIENILTDDLSWTRNDVMTFVECENPREFEEQMNKVVASKTGFLKPQLLAAFPELKEQSIYQLNVIPLNEVHFSTSTALLINRGKIEYFYILITIGALILTIACINYVLLSLASSAGRIHEVGVRKVLGATRNVVIRQFLTDSILLTTAAGILGLLLAHLFISDFNAVINKNLSFNTTNYPSIVLALIVAILFVGVIAGSYPAVWLAKLNPQTVFKQKFLTRYGGVFSQLLTFVQFTICLVFITCSWVMFDQISFIKNADIGFDARNIIQISALGIDSLEKKSVMERLRQELDGKPSIEGVSAISDFPFYLVEQIELRPGFVVDVNSFKVDREWNRVLGVPLLSGRDFQSLSERDSSNQVLVNEALAKMIPGDEIIGYLIPGTNKRVIGVVKNFHYESLAFKIAPTYFVLNKTNNEIFVRLSDRSKMPSSVLLIQTAWKSAVPNHRIVYSFADANFGKQYEDTENWQMIILYGTIYAIVVSCMGIFALSGFQATNSIKEIGVRKLFGAAEVSILWLLNRKVLIILSISFAVSIPVIYYFMDSWLSSFAYHVKWKWYWFAGTGVLGLVVIVSAVSYNVLRATRSNLVSVFKHE